MSEIDLVSQQVAVERAILRRNKLSLIFFVGLSIVILAPMVHMALESFAGLHFPLRDHLRTNFAALTDGDYDRHMQGYGTFAALYTALIAVLSLVVAFLGYNVLRDAESKSKTLDFITRQLHDGDIVKMFSEFRSLRKKYSSSVIFFDDARDTHKKNEEATEMAPTLLKQEYDLVVQLLNYYETWEIGIENHALDEGMLKDWWRSSLVGDFTDLYAFVLGYRDARKAPKTFEKVEQLAKRWAHSDELNKLAEMKKEYRARKRAAERFDERAGALFSIFKKKSESGAQNKRAA